MLAVNFFLQQIRRQQNTFNDTKIQSTDLVAHFKETLRRWANNVMAFCKTDPELPLLLFSSLWFPHRSTEVH